MNIRFAPMDAVPVESYVALNNHPLVRRLMPLSTGEVDLDSARGWLAAKVAHHKEHGYGPYAILVDGEFAGWGGLQEHEGDADLGLVLHPDFWGCGPEVARLFLRQAFDEAGLPSVIALLPPERTRVRALLRAGFVSDGETAIEGHSFRRFRLMSPRKPPSA